MNPEKPYQPSPEEMRKAEDSMTNEQRDTMRKRMWELEQNEYPKTREVGERVHPEIKRRIFEEKDDSIFDELYTQKKYRYYFFALECALGAVMDHSERIERFGKYIKEGLNNAFQIGFWPTHARLLSEAYDLGFLDANEMDAELARLQVVAPEFAQLAKKNSNKLRRDAENAGVYRG